MFKALKCKRLFSGDDVDFWGGWFMEVQVLAALGRVCWTTDDRRQTTTHR